MTAQNETTQEAPRWARRWGPVVAILLPLGGLVLGGLYLVGDARWATKDALAQSASEAKLDADGVRLEARQQQTQQAQQQTAVIERLEQVERLQDWQVLVLDLMARQMKLSVPERPGRYRGRPGGSR